MYWNLNHAKNYILRKLLSPFESLKLLLKSLQLIRKIAPTQFCLLSIGILIQGVTPAITIWISAEVITRLSSSLPLHDTDLIKLCLMWACSLLVSNLIQPWILSWQSNLSDLSVNKINLEIIKKSNAIQGLNYYENGVYNDDIQILQTQSSNKPINLVVTMVGLARDLVMILSGICLLYTIIPWISILVVLGAYVNFRIFASLQEKTWKESLGRSTESRKLKYLSSISLGAQYAKEVKLFNFGTYLLSQYEDIFYTIYLRMKSLRLKQAILPLFPFSLTIFGNLVAFYVVVKAAFSHAIPVGGIALFLQSLTQLHLSISSFGEQSGWMRGHLLFFNKFFNFLQLDEKVYHSPPITQIEKTEPIIINFDQVYFSYTPDKPILKNISFTIYNREKVAIVGLNGAGKTTLVKLLCGFYKPDSGEIRINNKRLSDIDLQAWRGMISPVFQDFNHYSFSIADNISMGATIDNQKLDQAISRAGLSELINQFSSGPEELLGKEFGGTDLSKGQWQKLAISKAIYKEASLYIFDEPTASLDPLSEFEIFEQFFEISEAKTVIFITHRLSSVIRADKILLIQDGALAAIGTHSELLKCNSEYREMFSKQAQHYQNPSENKITSLEIA